MGALTTAEDMNHLNKINDILRDNKKEEAIKYLKSIKWSPAGLSKKELISRYSWAQLKHPVPKYDLCELCNH